MNDGPGVEVRELQPEELDAAVGVLARGMRDNPLHVAAYGDDPARRQRVHARLMAAVFRTFPTQRPLCAVDGERVVGVTGVAPVGTCRPTGLQRVRTLPALIAVGPKTASQVGKWFAAWSEHDPDE